MDRNFAIKRVSVIGDLHLSVYTDSKNFCEVEMKLSAKTFKDATHRAVIKKIYLDSFPKYEKLPWWQLRLLTLRRGIEMTAYYDGDEVCGFTYTVAAGKILFVLFFAVKRDLRGMGYGSAILQYLKESAPSKAVLLNIEPLDSAADNFEERIRRFRFYEKNGFFDTKYEIEEIGGVFRILATSPDFDMTEYLRVFKKMSFGFWRPRIMPASRTEGKGECDEKKNVS